MEKKKLKDLTWDELDKCGEIEEIAYRGDKKWMQYDDEIGFAKMRMRNPEAYEEIEIVFSDNWFIIYLENEKMINLLDAARADIGDNQPMDKEEFRQCVQRLINKNKIITVSAKSDTSYYSFAKMAANGEIDIISDKKDVEGLLHDLIFQKAGVQDDLSEQMSKYTNILEEFDKNKDEYKAKRKKQLQRYMDLKDLYR